MTVPSRERIGLLLLAFCAATLAASPLLADGGLRTVALSGQQAAGLPPGTTFGTLAFPNLSDNGQVSFGATAGGLDEANFGFWHNDGEQTRLVVFPGLQAPGSPDGARFEQYDPDGAEPAISAGGDVAFVWPVFDSATNQGFIGHWTFNSENGLRQIASPGEAAPGLPDGVQFSGPFDGHPGFPLDFSTPLSDAAGNIAIVRGFQGPGVTADNGFGLWTGGGDRPLSLLARMGDQAPGLPEGVVFSRFDTARVSDDGFIVFTATVRGEGIQSRNNQAAWISNGGDEPVLSFREGEIVSSSNGFPFIFDVFSDVGGFLASARDLVVGNNGRIAARSSLGIVAGASPIFTNGVFPTRVVAVTGSDAPGFAEGQTFDFSVEPLILFDPQINAEGQVAFTGRVAGEGLDFRSNTGIWSEGLGNGLELVAREGDELPGLPDGVTVESFERVAFNDLGQVAFLASFNRERGRGIWAQSRSGELVPIVIQGQQIDVNDDPLVEDLQTVGFIELGPLQTGFDDPRDLITWFNNRGEVVFSTGRGVFVSSAVAVPEPLSAMFAVVALSVPLVCRRRRTIEQGRILPQP